MTIVVVDGVMILEETKSVAQAYVLNLAYPKELKNYYEFLQKVLMQMDSERPLKF